MTELRRRTWRLDLECGQYAEFAVHYEVGTVSEAQAMNMDTQFAIGHTFTCEHGLCAVANALAPGDEEVPGNDSKDTTP